MGVFLIALGVLFLDQGTKYLVNTKMIAGQSIPVIEGVFHLTYVQNRGAAFGILQGQTIFFMLVSVVILGLILYLLPRIPPDHSLLCVALGFLLGGAVGNLLDRILHSFVIDFFDFRIWPVFNIADIAIVSGVILFCWEILMKPVNLKGD